MAQWPYDDPSQLVGADYNYQTDETFAWDANGNPSGGSNTVTANNKLTTDGTYNYTYDDEGNLTKRTKISDSSYTDYTWDYHNRLTNVTSKTSLNVSTMQADYTYDVYDRRIKKVVDADGAGAGGSVTSRYVYEDTGYTQVVLQFDGSNNLTHRYLQGPAIDQLLADEDASNNLLWSLTDHEGTVRDLVNNSGVTQNHLKYAAFGNVTAESASAVDFLMGFAGMDRDEETGAYYSWERYLQGKRWESQDPWGFNAGDANLNRYLGNAVTLAIDPSGLDEIGGGPYDMGTLGPIGDNGAAQPGGQSLESLWQQIDGELAGGTVLQSAVGNWHLGHQGIKGNIYYGQVEAACYNEIADQLQNVQIQLIAGGLALSATAAVEIVVHEGSWLAKLFGKGPTYFAKFNNETVDITEQVQKLQASYKKMGKELDPKVAVAFVEQQLAESGVQIAVNTHHPIPKFLGGFVDQDLASISKGVHQEFHSLLGKELKAAGIPLNVGTKGGAASDWAAYFNANPGTHQKALDVVLQTAKAIDLKLVQK